MRKKAGVLLKPETGQEKRSTIAPLWLTRTDDFEGARFGRLSNCVPDLNHGWLSERFVDRSLAEIKSDVELLRCMRRNPALNLVFSPFLQTVGHALTHQLDTVDRDRRLTRICDGELRVIPGLADELVRVLGMKFQTTFFGRSA